MSVCEKCSSIKSKDRICIQVKNKLLKYLLSSFLVIIAKKLDFANIYEFLNFVIF